MDGLLNLIRREVARCIGRFAFPAVGIISSYDPATHSIKVQYQPEGTLSGWVPLNAAGVGAGFGVFVGPHIGHAVSIGFQEGDREAPFVIGRFATDVETPVSVAEGEIVAKHETGSSFSLLKDGSATLTDKGGITIKLDGAGNCVISGATTIKLGGTGATKAVALNGDPIVAGAVVASSTIVKAM